VLPGLRPTSDRVREAVFDILEARGLVEGASFLDLFAGSGALGIEALSRGAASCVFVESDRRAIAAIEANLAAVGLSGSGGGSAVGLSGSAGDSGGGPALGRGRIARSDALAYLRAGPAAVDVALVDPPYAFAGWAELLGMLPARSAVLEHNRAIDSVEPFHTLRSYRYGGTLVTLVAARHPTDKDSA
jgi:16S rRNA (guanine966-N2)-methyltransferase